VRKLSAPEWAVLAVVGLWAAGPAVAGLLHARHAGLVFAGPDGLYPPDQNQYFAMVREFGDHLLAGNDYSVGRPQRVFFHPLLFVAGLLVRAGVGVEAAWYALTPLAVAALFGGYLAYVRRTVSGTGTRAAALVLALFVSAPLAGVLGWASPDGSSTRSFAVVSRELMSASELWGYLPAAVALGLMPLFLLGLERLAGPGARRSLLAGVAVCGALVSWLHPWQGATLLLVGAGLALWTRADRATLRRLALPAVALAGPLVYYTLLARYVHDYEVARAQGDHTRYQLWVLALVFSPLLAAAAAARPWRSPAFQDRAMVLWMPAALAVYLTAPTQPSHALQGLGLPLAVLGVRAVAPLIQRRPARVAVALGAVALLTVPAMAYDGNVFADNLRTDKLYVLRPDESRALDWLEAAPRGGPVLAPFVMASAVPPRTGRQTWAGHAVWSPDEGLHALQAEQLFRGRTSPVIARSLLRQSRAAFLLAGCEHQYDLRSQLGGAIARVRRFGCATVYEVRQNPAP
jgi:hypothetical protein